MKEIFEHELLIAPSLCGADGRLSVPSAFAVFMDIAAEHAEALGVGVHDLARKDLFWLTVKTRIRFFERPAMMERLNARTWPEIPGKVLGCRSYQLLRGDTVLVSGKTEWAVTNTVTKQFAMMSDVYPPAMEFEASSALPGPFARIADSFDGAPFAGYTVRATDIDLGGHMNNAAYPVALLGCFSAEELHSLPIVQMDLIFRSPCYAGDRLALQRMDTADGIDLRLSRDGDTVLLARLTC